MEYNRNTNVLVRFIQKEDISEISHGKELDKHSIGAGLNFTEDLQIAHILLLDMRFFLLQVKRDAEKEKKKRNLKRNTPTNYDEERGSICDSNR